MIKALTSIAFISFIFSSSVFGAKIVLQQGTNYKGCSDAYIYDYPSAGGQNNERICVLYEC